MFKTPGFVIVVTVTLGLGIGANTAIFSLLDQAVLRSLPGITAPNELVLFDGPGAFRGRTIGDATFSRPMYQDFRARATVTSGITATMATAVTATWKGQSERVNSELVAGNYFSVLGVQPALGRVLGDADDTTPLGHAVVVLDHGYWTRRFGADTNVIGQALNINGHPLTVVGVTAPGFRGMDGATAPDVYVPVMMKAWMTPTWDDLDNRRSRWLTVFARLKPGVTPEAALAELNGIYHQINAAEIEQIPSPSKTFRERFLSKNLILRSGGRGRAVIDGNAAGQYVALMAMVALVLLIVCANVANLLIARSTARNREMAVRLALGASRAQLIRQTLTESSLLAIGGGLLGLVFALAGVRALIAALPDGARAFLTAELDPRMMAFAVLVTALTALVAGLGPALQVTRPALAGAIKDEGGAVMGGGRQTRVRRVLVSIQMGLSVLLLVGATLFARSLVNVRAVDPGVTIDNTLTFSMDPGLSGYDAARVPLFYEQVRDAIRAVPGVKQAAVSEIGLLTGSSWRSTVSVDGYTNKEGEDMNPDFNGVSPDFFRTMGVPITRGRDFTPADVAGAQRVAVVSQAFTAYFFKGENPIGRTFHVGGMTSPPITIVGEVRDLRSYSLRSEPVRFVYIPAYQDETLGGSSFYVAHEPGVTGITQAVRDAIQRVDPNVPVYDVLSFREQFERSILRERMVATLSSAFGVLATLLAAIGLYGVMSYSVARRTRELGVRMALGAAPMRVMGLVLRDVAILTVSGAVVGVIATYALLRYVGSRMTDLIFGLSVTDPVVYLVAFALLTVVALVAGYFPARRATRISPTVALRAE